jgi:molecular chaperone HtpG
MTFSKAHAIEVDLEKILPILAKEIYNTPFAFLRENIQNAVDAIRIQAFRDHTTPAQGGHSIHVTVDGDTVSIQDTGTGMSRGDLEGHYWVIGKSGKNTDEARRAGVVGTFGIGGMANFGVCSKLAITTRTELSSRAIRCEARREDLSATKDCVFYTEGPRDFARGTQVHATLLDKISGEDARVYLERIVHYLEMPVFINGTEIPRRLFALVDDEHSVAREATSAHVQLRALVAATANGAAEIGLDSLTVSGKPVAMCRGYLRMGSGGINAYQHGFLLCQVPAPSSFGLEGDLDCSLFRPTAGRESVTSETQQLIQRIVNAMEDALAEVVASSPTLADKFGSLFAYIVTRGKWILADNATIRQYGLDERVPLKALRDASATTQVYFVRDGLDRALLEAVRSQGKRIAILSTESKRQNVEQNYLKRLCSATLLEDRIECTGIIQERDLDPLAADFLARVSATLRTSFFVERVAIKAGTLTHGAMVWAPPKMDDSMTVVIDPNHEQVQRLLKSESSQAYGGLIDVFVRDSVFPHLEAAFPELRSRDFDLLLRRIQSTFEQFQVDPNDINRLQLLAQATNFSPETIARVVGVEHRRRPRPTTVKATDIVQVARIVAKATSPASKRNEPSETSEEVLARLAESEVDGKIIDATEVPTNWDMRGHYIALTPESHVLYRHVFDRKPITDFMWGGHRAAYVIYDQGDMVLYYDIELKALIEPTAASAVVGRTGSITVPRDPIMTKNMVFLPIPDGFHGFFVPKQDPLTFLIRHKIIGGGAMDPSGVTSET